MRDSFLVFGQPLILQPEMDEVMDCMRKAWLGTGPKAHAFEAQFADYVGGGFTAGVNSCTAAAHLALLALGLGAGDEVITTAMTFCSTVNTIIHAGATPVLADIDPQTLCISPESIEAAITPRTRAVVAVHFAGRPCDMDAITDICRRHNLFLVEDCAHAIETTYHGAHAGTFGDFGCFSFYSTKNVVTGEGGMVLSADKARIDRIKIMALHGMSADAWSRFSDAGYKHYQVVELGFKYNMMDMQAAIGIHQLARVEENWKRREAIWQAYMQAFAAMPLGLPAAPEADTRHACHLFTVRVNKAACGLSRDEMLVALHKRNIGCGVHYLAIPEHPYYRQRYGWRPEDTPHATAFGQETLSLPLSPKLNDDDVRDVVEAVSDVLANPSAR